MMKILLHQFESLEIWEHRSIINIDNIKFIKKDKY
jgi:hypothetical protein